ncbi:hypothetical protein AVEN_195-1 [Araneus ventricosus]|uniref:Uncharacterized protein n=1 Tax=Araneus ventricosus TaxID=182803 RepID=A0A4Y2D2A6_ARAVE|nr:hypothetical protein AVEN_195-1 [Araneus ventricosus]
MARNYFPYPLAPYYNSFIIKPGKDPKNPSSTAQLPLTCCLYETSQKRMINHQTRILRKQINFFHSRVVQGHDSLHCISGGINAEIAEKKESSGVFKVLPSVDFGKRNSSHKDHENIVAPRLQRKLVTERTPNQEFACHSSAVKQILPTNQPAVQQCAHCSTARILMLQTKTSPQPYSINENYTICQNLNSCQENHNLHR